MAKLTEHPSDEKVNLLVSAPTGTGKTGVLSTLINDPEYRVIIFDFDNGLDILRDYCDRDAQSRTLFRSYERDDAKNKPQAWIDFENDLYNGWTEDDGEVIPPLKQWPSHWVAVVDTLTFASEAVKNLIKFEEKKWTKQEPMSQPMWGAAIQRMDMMIGFLTSSAVSASVIVNAHVIVANDDVTGKEEWAPKAITRNSSTMIGSYFNNMFLLKLEKRKDQEPRLVFQTAPDLKMACKTARPNTLDKVVPADYSKLFATLKGSKE